MGLQEDMEARRLLRVQWSRDIETAQQLKIPNPFLLLQTVLTIIDELDVLGKALESTCTIAESDQKFLSIVRYARDYRDKNYPEP